MSYTNDRLLYNGLTNVSKLLSFFVFLISVNSYIRYCKEEKEVEIIEDEIGEIIQRPLDPPIKEEEPLQLNPDDNYF